MRAQTDGAQGMLKRIENRIQQELWKVIAANTCALWARPGNWLYGQFIRYMELLDSYSPSMSLDSELGQIFSGDDADHLQQKQSTKQVNIVPYQQQKHSLVGLEVWFYHEQHKRQTYSLINLKNSSQ